ncbi:hypothetical protein KJ966_31760 [bacterium]|nr:hypothetical protein [bacterium]
MKIRNGFVSNSSSSSFVCNICGETESGWDLSLSEADMMMCEHGHVFCKRHHLDSKITNKILQKWEFVKGFIQENSDDILKALEGVTSEEVILQTLEDYDYDLDDLYDEITEHQLPESCCPVCQLKYISDDTLLHFTLHKYNISRETLETEMRTKFPNLQDFFAAIK